MVRIKYYSDPMKECTLDSVYNTVGDFIIDYFGSADKKEILDLIYFDQEILGYPINTNTDNASFIDINDGIIAITHESMLPKTPVQWAYFVVVVVLTAYTLSQLSNIQVPDNLSQKSATNKLGDTTNQARVNERIDDIFGTVNKHMPPLIQEPYKIGLNNQEVEVLLLSIGRGRYQYDENHIWDGDTLVKNIPGAKWSVYAPYTYPGKGIPEFTIGSIIDEPIGIYKKSNDLNSTELLPPNDTQYGEAARWVFSSLGVILLDNALDLDYDLTNSFSIGDPIVLSNCFYYEETGTSFTLYNEEVQHNFVLEALQLSDFSGVYTVKNVTSDSITVDLDIMSTVIQNIWANFITFELKVRFYYCYDINGLLFISDNDVLERYKIWSDIDTSNDITVEIENKPYSIGNQIDSIVGPISIPEGSSEVLLNFVSEQGFYKLDENHETYIDAEILITYRELDENGNPTDNNVTELVDYSTNNDSYTSQVFKTVRSTVPYLRTSISCNRLTYRDKSRGISNVDRIVWRDIYTYKPSGISNVDDYGDITIAHVLIPSNSTSRLIKERKQNLDVTRKITQYLGNGEFGPAESYATNDFSQILIHTALDPYIGRLKLRDINADGFINVKNQILEYFNNDIDMISFGHDFDDSDITFQDTYMTICNAVMCIPYTQVGVYDLFFEHKQDSSSSQITIRNKDPESETRKYNYDILNDGVQLTYRDNETGGSKVITYPNDGSVTNPITYEMPGVTNELQAIRHVLRKWYKLQYKREVITFDVDDFGRNIIPGKRIDSPDSTRFTYRDDGEPGYHIFEGNVVEVTGLNVELSEPVFFVDNEDYYISFTNNKGEKSEPIKCIKIDDFNISLDSLPSTPIYDGYDKDKSTYILTSEQLLDSVAMIPETIETTMNDNGSETITITSSNYDERYYYGDTSYNI